MASRLQVLREQKARVVRSMEGALAAADSAGRDLNEEELATYAGWKNEMDGLKGKIEREEELLAYQKSLSPPDPNAEEDHWPGQLEGGKKRRVGNPREALAEDPKFGFRQPRDLFLAVQRATQRRQIDHPDWAGLKHLAVPQKALAAAGSDEHSTFSDPYGGFFVPTIFLNEFWTLPSMPDPVSGLVTQIPMETPRVEVPACTDKDHSTSVSGGLVVTRKAESVAATASRMATEKIAMTATSLFGVAIGTEELLRDSAISFTAILEKQFAKQFAAHLLNERIRGTGVGEFVGVTKSGCLVTVAKEANQAADTITALNLIDMRARCWGYGDAIWLYNQDCLPQLMTAAHIVGVTAVLTWQSSLIAGEPDKILGRPAYPCEFCSTVGNLGDVILGNWSQYLEGTYQPIDFATSMHVRFLEHEQVFKFYLRNAGAPWWRVALTPAQSTVTLSPFVVLAAR